MTQEDVLEVLKDEEWHTIDEITKDINMINSTSKASVCTSIRRLDYRNLIEKMCVIMKSAPYRRVFYRIRVKE